MLLYLIATSLSAQSAPADLFVNVKRLEDSPSSALAMDPAFDRMAVGMQLQRLFGAADEPAMRVHLNVGSHRWVAQFDRLDRHASGFRAWVGHIEGIEYSHVVFTERDGIVSGLIDAHSTSYRLRSITPGSYLLEQVVTPVMRRELEPVPGEVGAGASRLDRTLATDMADVIDVLMLYTPRARSKAGGIAQIQALAVQVISDSNSILGRSGLTTRLRLASATEFSLVEASAMTSDLFALRDSAVARSLRDATRADLVQLLVSSPDLTACGIAVQLSSLIPGFDAFSVADISCVAQYTPIHELAHTMGAHHAPEDGPFNGLFPYSYGYKDPERRFRTVMALQCSNSACPRIPHFSNPTVPYNGQPTGTFEQNNALSIVNAAPAVANWRQGGDIVTPPAAPTGLRSQTFGTLASGDWDEAANAFSYTLQIGRSPGASDVFNAPLGLTRSVVGTMLPGRYFWRVFASNVAGSSPPSSEAELNVEACSVPGVPGTLTFSVSGAVVTLMWSAPSAGVPVTGYVLEAGSAPGLANLFSGNTGSSGPGVVTAAPSGTYFVRVRARNACGVSTPSNEQVISVP